MIKSMLIMCALIAASLSLLPQKSLAQTQVPTMQEADKLYQAQKWEASAVAYEALTKANPTQGLAWYRLGVSLNSLGKYVRAGDALQKSVDIGHRPEAMYALAHSYALMKDNDHAFEWLTKAVENNLPQPRRITSDQNLVGLRDDLRAKSLLALIEQKARVCMNIPEYRQFDFWVGDWNVFDPAGQQVGTNEVVLLQDGCVVEENWVSAGGETGQSFNFYNPSTHKWHQSYMDRNGKQLDDGRRIKRRRAALRGRDLFANLEGAREDDLYKSRSRQGAPDGGNFLGRRAHLGCRVGRTLRP